MFTLICFYLLVFVYCVPGESETLQKRNVFFPLGCPKMYLGINVPSFVTYDNSNTLVRWRLRSLERGDWIGIFQSDPKTGKVVLEPKEVLVVEDMVGQRYIPLPQEITKPKNLGFKSKCLDYYAGYFDKCHNCLGVTCMKTEPDWMWTMKKMIEKKKIRDIVIPGTHQSGWYADNVKNIPFKNRMQKQDETVLGQLIYGTRYLHLAVGYYENEKNKWWVSHPYGKLCPVDIIFKDIRTFLENTQEIVILDIKDFNKEFHDSRVHIWFISHLNLAIGDLAVPNYLTWNTTFEKVWRTKRRLIIAYNFKEAVQNYKFLWSSFKHLGQREGELSSLHDTFERILANPPNTVWTAAAYITGTEGRYEDISDEKVNVDINSFKISRWYARERWLRRSNIVVVDFIRTTRIVRAAIEINSGEC